MNAILPPASLGILGGGQLGRYFVMAARTMGYRTVVLEPDPLAPAGAAADLHIVAAYDDPEALAAMSRECAAVTTEFENAPASAMAALAISIVVRPSAAAIEITQDRRLEKQFLQAAGLPVAPYAVIEHVSDLTAPPVGFPAILKTARMGYDGNGQVAIAAMSDLAAGWDRLGAVPCVLEQRLVLQREMSVVLARGVNGDVAIYPAVTNTHVDGILDLTVVPDRSALAEDAAMLAETIANALDYVGVLAVELFVVDGALLINELAPRPHNSGHWTLDAAATSQFEQQVRALCGLPLGDTRVLCAGVAMANLLGDMWADGPPDWAAALSDPGAHLHLYSKREARAGRKMGHLTVLADTPDAAAHKAERLRNSARS